MQERGWVGTASSRAAHAIKGVGFQLLREGAGSSEDPFNRQSTNPLTH